MRWVACLCSSYKHTAPCELTPSHTHTHSQSKASLSGLPQQDPRLFFNSPAMISNLTAILELVQSPTSQEERSQPVETSSSSTPHWTKKLLLQEASEHIADGARADVFKL